MGWKLGDSSAITTLDQYPVVSNCLEATLGSPLGSHSACTTAATLQLAGALETGREQWEPLGLPRMPEQIANKDLPPR